MHLGRYTGLHSCIGMSFIPQRYLNRSAKEVAKAVRLTNRQVEYVSFKMPWDEAS